MLNARNRTHAKSRTSIIETSFRSVKQSTQSSIMRELSHDSNRKRSGNASNDNDSDMFEKACFHAATNYKESAIDVINLAHGNLDTMIEFATILINGPVGYIGSRRNLRAAATIVLDKVLEEDSNHTSALCVKGEMLLPRELFGTGPTQTPYSVIEEAYVYFCKADILGSREGHFLRGRWLVTMWKAHRNEEYTREGMKYVREAADGGHARAMVFIAQMYEFPGRFGRGEGGASEAKLEEAVKLYEKAADLGDANALNDMGSSYASAFGGLPFDFDKAVDYYIRSIKAGGLMGFENLGTHYETGMSGEACNRIDNALALRFYKLGAQLRCAKCCYNMAILYAQGLGGVIQRDTNQYERYLRRCMLIAYDDNDDNLLDLVKNKLIALYMFRVVVNDPDSIIVKQTYEKLKLWLNQQVIMLTLQQLNRCLANAVKHSDYIECCALLGDINGQMAFNQAVSLAAQLRTTGNPIDLRLEYKLKHIFGDYVDIVRGKCTRLRRLKRRRLIVSQV